MDKLEIYLQALKRAHFYRGTYALSEALHGVKSGDKEAFTSGIAQYT